MSSNNQKPKVSSFHSSVNCIPVLRPPTQRPSPGRTKDGAKSESVYPNLPEKIATFLSDAHPNSLDHLGGDTYSGSLRLTIEVMTALIFGNQVQAKGKPTEISIPTDPATGNPFIPPTMIKGMISNAYERLTASRFRVLGDHSAALTYRADPAAALELVPVRLSEEYDQGTHRGTLLYGPERTLYAKLLTHEEIDDDKKDQKKRLPLLKGSAVWDDLHHSELVDFKAKKVKDSYIVTRVKCPHKEDYLLLNVPHWVSESPSEEKPYRGWFYSTTPDDQLKEGKSIFDSKLSERIFFYDQENSSEIEISPTAVEKYDRIIRSYSYDSTDTTSKRPTTPSRFVIDRAGQEDIDPIDHSDLLAYARLQGGKVVEIMPTQVGRRNYSRSPRNLAQQQGVLPAAHASEASPADRVFGFILKDAQTPSEQPDDHASALRGRIMVGTVDASNATPNTEQIVLRPLFAPKLSSARRFLTDVSGHTISGRSRPEYYAKGDLLGAASYPFRRGDAKRKKQGDGRLPYANLASYEKEVMEEKPNSIKRTNPDIYSIVKKWIPRGSKFHCTLRFEGLRKEELWTLLWVLDSKLLGQYARIESPQQDSDQGKGKAAIEGYLRLGMGKPLGLGVVHTSFSSLSFVKTASGADNDMFGLVDDYVSLEGCLGVPDPEKYELNEEWRADFFEDAKSFYEDLSMTPWCKAFLRSCVGYPGKTEVRYMKLSENKRNNKTDKTGNPHKGCALAPRSLADDCWTASLEVPDES